MSAPGEAAMGAGEFAVGAGDLQLGRDAVRPLEITHVALDEEPYHKWIVRWSDGTTEDVHDACQARMIGEQIHA